MTRSILVAAIVVGALGCGASPIQKRKAIKSCDFRIRAASVGDVRMRSTTVIVDLDVYNPNPHEVIVDELDYCVLSEGDCFVRGHVATPLVIPKYQSRPMQVKADVGYFSTAGALKRLVGLQRTRYQLTGTVYLQTFLGRIPFDVKSRVRSFP